MDFIDTFESLRKKDVINLCDGTRFGHTTNLELNLQTGTICKLIVPVCCGCFSFVASRKEYRIPWDCIRKIGDDTILVEVDPERVLFEK